LWKKKYFLPSLKKVPYQTPEVLLSYVSKDLQKGEGICRFLALPATPIRAVLGSSKWLPKHVVSFRNSQPTRKGSAPA
jgi:hypothetical protein